MSDTTKESGAPGEGVTAPSVIVPLKSNVYMVYSQLSLAQLHQDLSRYGTIGLLRIVLDGDGRETNRNVAVFHDDVYQRLLSDGYGERNHWNNDFSVHPFQVRPTDLPGPGKSSTLFVPVPHNLLAKEGTVRKEIVDKLQHLVEWGVIPPDSWKIVIPLKSRERSDIRGGGILISFLDLSLHHIALVRVALADTRWLCLAGENGDNNNVFRCYWVRDRNHGENGTSKEPKSHKEPRSPKEPTSPKEPRSPKEPTSPKDPRSSKKDKYSKKGRKGQKPPGSPADTKPPKPPKSPADTKPPKSPADTKPPKSPADTKPKKAFRARKQHKPPKDDVLNTVDMPTAPQPTLISTKDTPTVTVPLPPVVAPTVTVPLPPVVAPTVTVPRPPVVAPTVTVPRPPVVAPPVTVPLPPVVAPPVTVPLPPVVAPPVAISN